MALLEACAVADLPASGALCKRLGSGTQVAVARLADGRIVAFENRCPHVDGPIGLGKIAGTQVICPWHFFRFDVVTGKAVGLESVMQLKTFKTTVEGGKVHVEL